MTCIRSFGLFGLLVKALIVPFRSPRSAGIYKEKWNENTGSPLLHYSRLQQRLLQDELGSDYQVELAMRYQSPTIASALKILNKAGCSNSQ